jgi:phage host-nuclease inhibitor protein Gam
MSKKREKRTVITEEITMEKAEQYFAEYAGADAKIGELTSKMDVEITRIREKYQGRLAELSDTKEQAAQKLQHFAESRRQELFIKKKTLDLLHGSIGFRTGNFQLKTLKGFTWDAVRNLVKEFLPDYIRTKEEVDKESLLADRSAALDTDDEATLALPEEQRPKVSSLFEKCGVRVAQEETFFIEPKKEELVMA